MITTSIHFFLNIPPLTGVSNTITKCLKTVLIGEAISPFPTALSKDLSC